jgi:phosphopantetheinyl transferase
VRIQDEPNQVSISLSHAVDTALCTVASPTVALGCDVETVEPRIEGFVHDYFTAAECSLIEGLPPGERDQLITLMWCAKESTLKALREGLRRDTRDVEVRYVGMPRPSSWQPMSIRNVSDAKCFAGWWRIEDQMVMTVVAAPTPRLPIRLNPPGQTGS